MTRRLLEEQLHSLEEVSEHALGYAPVCLKAACAAAEVGDLNTCLTIIDHSIPSFVDGTDDVLQGIGARLIGLSNQLTYHPTAA